MPRDLQARGLSPSEVCRFVYNGELGVKGSLSRQLRRLSQSHGTDWVRRRRVVLGGRKQKRESSESQ